MKILILGGTGEARELAARLVALGHEVTTSLAGRTQRAGAAGGRSARRQVRRRSGARGLSRRACDSTGWSMPRIPMPG